MLSDAVIILQNKTMQHLLRPNRLVGKNTLK